MSSHTIDSLRWNIDEELLLAMTYNAVFDESGKHADSEVVIFAGFFSTDEKWTEFGREWKTLLRKNDLTHFHMVDAVQTNGQFRKFRKQKSALSSLVVSLADLVCQYAMEGTINQVSTSHFNALKQAVKIRYKDPFYYAFEAGIELLMKSPTLEPGDRFNLICDDSEEYSSECLKAYYAFRRVSMGEKEGLSAEVLKKFLEVFSDHSRNPLIIHD